MSIASWHVVPRPGVLQAIAGVYGMLCVSPTVTRLQTPSKAGSHVPDGTTESASAPGDAGPEEVSTGTWGDGDSFVEAEQPERTSDSDAMTGSQRLKALMPFPIRGGPRSALSPFARIGGSRVSHTRSADAEVDREGRRHEPGRVPPRSRR